MLILLFLAGQEASPALTLEAAKAMVELRTPAAMSQRFSFFEASWEMTEGVLLRDALYAGMRRAEELEEGDLLARAAADGLCSEALRRLCLLALEESETRVSASFLFHSGFLSAPPAVLRAWQSAAGRCLAQERVAYAAPADAASARATLLAGGAPFLGHAFLPEWSAEEAAAIFLAATQEQSAPDRAEALRVLATRHADQAAFVAAASAALEAPDRAPRAAVLIAAVEHDAYEAVPIIVRFLEQAAPAAEGRWVHDAAESLQQLTGLPFGPKPEVWRKWLMQEFPSWLQERRARKEPPTVADGVQRANESDTVSSRFFGLPVDSTRVGIIVDGSDNMSAGLLAEIGAAAAVAREVHDFCAKLPAKAVFQVWMAEEHPLALFKKAMPANRTNRRQAERFVQDQAFRSGVALVEALEAAMQDPALDTLVFVGSGSRSAGLHADEDFVIAAAKRLYARHGVRIHTVLIPGFEEHAGFLLRLAEAAGGRMGRMGQAATEG